MLTNIIGNTKWKRSIRYGIFKFDKSHYFFIIIDRDKSLVYGSKIGSIYIVAFSLRDGLQNEEIKNLIEYLKLRMEDSVGRNIVCTDNYMCHFH